MQKKSFKYRIEGHNKRRLKAERMKPLPLMVNYPMSNNKKPEHIVKAACLNRLSQWQHWGVVIEYDDVSCLGRTCHGGRWVMHTNKGKRDLIALFKVGSVVWIYLIEVKSHDGGVWSKQQQEYAQRFAGLENVIYEVISNARQIDTTLEHITKRSALLLAEADRHCPEGQRA